MLPLANDFISKFLGIRQERSKVCHKVVIMRFQQGVVKRPSEGNKYFGEDITYG